VDCASELFRKATFLPDSPLRPSTSYAFVINGDGQLGLMDAAGNPADGVDIRSSGFFFETDG
jgi:hypothetical protein